ncbi:MAG: HAMP domain-containing histidine kinase [Alphaproteobacteria bacterium]|nr:HAMP domain-containing histidine kinase [Alphaproteobacteria bacterium]
MAPPSVADPELALRWLRRVRQAFLGAQALLVLLVALGDGHGHHVPGWLGVLGLAFGLDLLVVRRGRGRVATTRTVGAHALVDLVGMSAVLLASGGAQNPLQAFLLVEVALWAVVLPPRQAWTTTLLALAAQAVVVGAAVPMEGLDDEPHEHPGHLLGHVLAFDVAALATTAFLGRLSATLRDREAALRAAELRQGEAERLAALGTLAAGTAHALATPLGAIELLGEEMALELPDGAPGHAAWAALRGEVARSRAILDRLLLGDAGAGGRTLAVAEAVAGWVESWRRAQAAPPVLAVAGVDALGDTAVTGAPEGWRDALWTLLDNARLAGGPLRVVLARDDGAVQLAVEDEGPRADPEALRHAGEPFRSAWPQHRGTGLGVYVARRFARSTGGDLLLAPRDPRGVRATLVMPVEGR